MSANTKSFVSAASLLLLLAVAACGGGDLGEARLKSIPKDASREQVLSAIGDGPIVPITATDSFRVVQGYRRQLYTVEARQYEVIWYHEAPTNLNDAITREQDTPIVLQDGTFIGYGWSMYNRLASEKDLPNPLRGRERLDSISRSQRPAS